MREQIAICQDWNFSLPNQACAESVCLPHTVKPTPANSSGGRNYQGLCRYEKELFIGAEKQAGKVWISFDGIMGYSKLYLNGELVKEHFCGYIPLVADITDFIRYGEKNTVTVTADNRDCEDYPPGKAQADLDFSYDGGIYRDAQLIFTDKVYITNPLSANETAGGGIFVHYENISKQSADLKIKTHIQNDRDSECVFQLVHKLKDAAGSVVATATSHGILPPHHAQHFENDATVFSPHLWEIHNPYLYTLETEVSENGIVLDHISTTTGIRTVEFTLDRGTLFNEKNIRIHGANYHQTYPYIGNAVPISLLKRDFLKLKDCGMENIRSHYPFATALVEFCNEIGMTLIVSNVGWQFCKEGIFFERVCQNMREIIRWQRNNPCIILWEPILNESRINLEQQTILADIVREEYPYAGTYSASDWGPTDISYKEYDPAMLGQGMEDYGLVCVNDGKQRPKWVREYGDAPDNFNDQNAVWRSPRSFGEHAMIMTVDRMLGKFDTNPGTYTTVLNNPSLCGFGVWPGIEHNRGYHINPCWGGYLDLFRIPKYGFHFMKSQQDIAKIGPYLFIANAWSEISPGDVTVYSNADTVRLYHDDVLVAEQKPDDIPVKHPPFTFEKVRQNYKTRARSTLRAEAVVGGEVVATASVTSPGVPKALHLEADFMDVPLRADGADIVLVRCSVTDIDGNLVPQVADNHPILFEIEGEGSIVGDETIGANPIHPECGIATVLVKSTKKAGRIKITARQLWPQPGIKICLDPFYAEKYGLETDPIGLRDASLVIESIRPDARNAE